MNLLKVIFGDLNEKEVKKLMKTVNLIEALDEQMKQLSDEELKNKTQSFKNRLENGELLDDILVEAFAVVRESADRVLGIKHYPVQLLGGIVLHQGRIAEMKTGEGKTLMATCPVYLNALLGKGVHVVTVNDYLAQRDKVWMGKLYNFLGLTVGCVVHGVRGKERRDAYKADITYGTNNEFGFDYLRDNMSVQKENLSQRPLYYAIVDEVDSILVDEARTPLIISGDGAKGTQLYTIADNFAKTLNKTSDVLIDEKKKTIHLTDELEEGQTGITGVEKAEKFFNIENLTDLENMEIAHHINQAIRARMLMKKDVDYVIKDGEIVIVDEFTGRLMFGRRYSNGLHQAIEAKENIEIRKESKTLATITIQNYFRMYQKLSGMTGTAKTEEEEFRDIYDMDVVVIPTNRPIARNDLDDAIYKTLEGKFKAVIEDIKEKAEKQQPVLVGTISIETSEFLGKMLKREGIKCEVLNAKQHEREAEIVSQAGRLGAVTIATNMAGRGTDIILGGNPDFMTQRALVKKGYSEEIIDKAINPFIEKDEELLEVKKIYDELFKDFKATTDEEGEEVKALGGLHIIGTERHEARRIDNQLRGRAGRQGDPGSSRFYISFEDDLMRLFLSEKAKDFVNKLGLDENTTLENPMLSRQIEGAQKRVEGRNYGIRKHVLQYDDVINRQREIIYSERNKVLHGDDIKEHILGMIDKIIDGAISSYTEGYKYPEDWDLEGLKAYLESEFMPKDSIVYESYETMTKESLKEALMDNAKSLYQQKEEEIGQEHMRKVERAILLKVVDSRWIDHIDAMDQFKQGVGLRAIGQQDPVIVYKMEGFEMFDEMIQNIRAETVKFLFHASIHTDDTRHKVAVVTSESGPQENLNSSLKEPKNIHTNCGDGSSVKKPFVSNEKIGRNDPCPCGSGKKYKKCCMDNNESNEI